MNIHVINSDVTLCQQIWGEIAHPLRLIISLNKNFFLSKMKNQIQLNGKPSHPILQISMCLSKLFTLCNHKENLLRSNFEDNKTEENKLFY